MAFQVEYREIERDNANHIIVRKWYRDRRYKRFDNALARAFRYSLKVEKGYGFIRVYQSRVLEF